MGERRVGAPRPDRAEERVRRASGSGRALGERVFNPEVYEGYEGIMRWRADVGDVWESYRSEPEEFFDGEEAVVVFVRERGRGKGSGIEVDRPTAFLCRLRSGRVSEIRLYLDRKRALRDAGLGQ